MKHEPTDEQKRIFAAVGDPKGGNIVVEALAGSGKSTTALESLRFIPQRSILMAAFNRNIAQNLETKLPKLPRTHAVHVKTFHALGFAMIKAANPKIERSEDAIEDLVTRVCAGRSISFNQKRWIGRLTRLLKETTIVAEPALADVLELGFEHDIFGMKATPDAIEEACERAVACYVASQDFANLKVIDFCDMTWLPTIARLPPVSRYQAIIIDELQDISEPQFALLRHVGLPTTRWIAIGDRNQAIYGWRGALGDRAWAIMQNEFAATTMPLSTTFRCCQEVVREANAIVPQLKALPDFDGGTVSTIPLVDLPNQFVGGDRGTSEIHTFVLSRRNDALLDCALFLHRNKVKFHLNAGKEMLSPLFYLLDFVLDTTTWAKFEESLKEWYKKETAKAIKHDSPSMADRAAQHHAMLYRCALESGQHPHKIKGILHALLVPNTSGVLLSTVHKVKGLEADRVFLLKQSFARHRRREEAFTRSAGSEPAPGSTQITLPNGKTIGLADWVDDGLYSTISFSVDQEELNLEYVAITRARWHLTWVEAEGENIATAEPTKIDSLFKDAFDKSGLTAKARQRIASYAIPELEQLFSRAEREAQRLGSTEDGRKWMMIAEQALKELRSKEK